MNNLERPGVQIKRIHEPARREDGYRILIDRLWPRGITKQAARLDEWARELAPSDELRRWFGHDPPRFDEFRRRYLQELTGRPESLAELRARAQEGRLTLLFSARDEQHNNAVVLAEAIAKRT